MEHPKNSSFPERFNEIESLAQGGMASVFRAFDKKRQEYVALKRLLPAIEGATVEEQRLAREAQVGMSLHHPNVVQVYDLIRCDNGLLLVMELVPGANLRQRMANGLAAADALGILEQVSAALTAAHAAGIVHRDLKPENVLVTDDDRVKVGDWGLTKRQNDTTGLTKTGIILGTPRYMAPEQILGGPLSAAIDVYALGVLLFELLTGSLPFPDGNLATLLHGHLEVEPRSLSDVIPNVDSDLADLSVALLSKDPSVRPSAKVVKKRLAGAQASASDLKSTAPPLERTRRVGLPPATEVPKKISGKSKRPFPQFLFILCALFVTFILWRSIGGHETGSQVSEDSGRKLQLFRLSFQQFADGKKRQLPEKLIDNAREVDRSRVIDAIRAYARDVQIRYRAKGSVDINSTRTTIYKLGALIELLQRRLRPNKPDNDIDIAAVSVAEYIATAVMCIYHKLDWQTKQFLLDKMGTKGELESYERELVKLQSSIYEVIGSGLSNWVAKGQLHPALELLNILLKHRVNNEKEISSFCQPMRLRMEKAPWQGSSIELPIISYMFNVEMDSLGEQLKLQELLALGPRVRDYIINRLPEPTSTGPSAFYNAALVKACEAYQKVYDRLLADWASSSDVEIAFVELEKFLAQAKEKPMTQVFTFNFIYRYAASNDKRKGRLLEVLQKSWQNYGRGKIPKATVKINGLKLEGHVTDGDGKGERINIWLQSTAIDDIRFTSAKDGSFACQLPEEIKNLSEQVVHLAFEDYPHNGMFIFLQEIQL